MSLTQNRKAARAALPARPLVVGDTGTLPDGRLWLVVQATSIEVQIRIDGVTPWWYSRQTPLLSVLIPDGAEKKDVNGCGWCDKPLDEPERGCPSPLAHPPAPAVPVVDDRQAKLDQVRQLVKGITASNGFDRSSDRNLAAVVLAFCDFIEYLEGSP